MENVEKTSIISTEEQAKEKQADMTEPEQQTLYTDEQQPSNTAEKYIPDTVEKQTINTTEPTSLINSDVAETQQSALDQGELSLETSELHIDAPIDVPHEVSDDVTLVAMSETASDPYVTPRSTLEGATSQQPETPRALSDESGNLEKEELEFGEFDDRSVLRTSSSFDIIVDEEIDNISDEDIENMNNLANVAAKPTSEIFVDSKQIEDLFKYKQTISADDMCKWSTASTCSNDTIAQQRIFMNESTMTEVERVGEMNDNGIDGDEIPEDKLNDTDDSPAGDIPDANNDLNQDNPPPIVELESFIPVEAPPIADELTESSNNAAAAVAVPNLAENPVKTKDLMEAKDPELPNESESLNESPTDTVKRQLGISEQQQESVKPGAAEESKQTPRSETIESTNLAESIKDSGAPTQEESCMEPEAAEPKSSREPETGVGKSKEEEVIPEIPSKPDETNTPDINEIQQVAEESDLEKPSTSTEEKPEEKPEEKHEEKPEEKLEEKPEEEPSKTQEEESKEKEGAVNDGWVDVLGSGALKKRTKKEGSGENLEKGQQVRMKYTLMLSSGKIVDDGLEQTFQLGDGEVIDAIDLTANLAKVGEVYEAMSQSRFAYGIQGRPPQIGPNSAVLMIVEIIQAEDTPKILDMAEVERIKIGDRKRKIGNDHFARHDYARASTNYQSACKYLDPPSYELVGEVSSEVKDLQSKTWCNLALSELKNGKCDAGIIAADRALKIDPKSTKALYRKGKLLEEKGELEQAELVLKQALKIDPNSVGCKQFLKELSQKLSNQKKKQQRMYKKMLNLEEEDEDEQKKETTFAESQTSWLEAAIPTIAGSVTVGALAMAAYYGIKSLQG